jgi:hypothetical protein
MAYKIGVDTVALENIVGGYETEAVSLFDRMTVRPDNNRRAAINTLIATLKANSIWASLDGLYLFGAHTSQAGLLNWCRNSANFTAVNSPNFVADIGFSGDGVSSYLLMPNNAGNQVTTQPTNIQLSVWVSQKPYVANEASLIAMAYGWNTYLTPAADSTRASWLVTRASTTSPGRMFTTSSRTGLFTLTRPTSSAAYLYRDGSLIGTDSTSYDTGAGATTEISIFKSASYASVQQNAATSTVYSTGTVSFCCYGSGLTNSQTALLYNAINDYMTAINLRGNLGL